MELRLLFGYWIFFWPRVLRVGIPCIQILFLSVFVLLVSWVFIQISVSPLSVVLILTR